MKYIILFFSFYILIGCGEAEIAETPSSFAKTETKIQNKSTLKLDLNLDPYDREPNEWGENVTGVKTNFLTDKKEMALTFDACGGDLGNGYDEALIEYLREEEIPATLFINEQWIAANEETFYELYDNPLFQIENHGTTHSPLSVNGASAWGISGTSSPQEVVAEIMDNHDTVKDKTGHDMTLFRSGTAYYDEVAVELANNLGYEVVNFDILGDAGATYSAREVKHALLQAEPGSIALLHMNQPQSETAEGVQAAIPILRAEGFEFVPLADQELK
jgi:peptidoglycan/xylan/chitin deacetylase (PgdA/CDA1 family)